MGYFRRDRQRRSGPVEYQGPLAHFFRAKWAWRFPRAQRPVHSLPGPAALSQCSSTRFWRGAGGSDIRASRRSGGLLVCVSFHDRYFCGGPLLSGNPRVELSRPVFPCEQSTGVRCRGVSVSLSLGDVSVFRIRCTARGNMHTPQLPWAKIPAMTSRQLLNGAP